MKKYHKHFDLNLKLNINYVNFALTLATVIQNYLKKESDLTMSKKFLMRVVTFVIAVSMMFSSLVDVSAMDLETLPQITSDCNVKYEGEYYSKEEVAIYLYKFGVLPPNYITKSQAKKLGWKAKKGNLWEVSDRKCIGGDVFTNYQKLVPSKEGRDWFECDVNYTGGFRGSDRLIYSSDGLIYFTCDHYKTARLLLKKDFCGAEGLWLEKESAKDSYKEVSLYSDIGRVIEGRSYTDRDSVAEYIYEYGELPKNYLTKQEAKSVGWRPKKANLWDVTDNGCIGGDTFIDKQSLLPWKKGRVWYECDVNYGGGKRGKDRLIYSNDGLIYYTNNHYKTVIQLY